MGGREAGDETNMSGHFKKYLMGYSVGYELGGSAEVLEETVEEFDDGRGMWWLVRRVRVFPTRSAAARFGRTKAAQDMRLQIWQFLTGQPLPAFYTQPHVYSTPNPKNAKGLIPLEEATDLDTVYINTI